MTTTYACLRFTIAVVGWWLDAYRQAQGRRWRVRWLAKVYPLGITWRVVSRWP